MRHGGIDNGCARLNTRGNLRRRYIRTQISWVRLILKTAQHSAYECEGYHDESGPSRTSRHDHPQYISRYIQHLSGQRVVHAAVECGVYDTRFAETIAETISWGTAC